MSTADPGLEADLFRVLAFQPSPRTIELADRRVADALAAHSRKRARGGPRFGRRAAAIALVATSLLLVGASGGLQRLYGLLSGPFDIPWHHGQVVNQSQVVDGYRVTIDRAYADATRLALAISVVDELERPGISQLGLTPTIVTDAGGEYTSGGGAVGAPDGRFATTNVVWKTPPSLPVESGPRLIHVVVPYIQVRDDATPPPEPHLDPDPPGDEWSPWRDVAGPWTFEFEIVVDGGRAIEPAGATVDASGHEVTITRVIAAPSIVRLDVSVDGARPGNGWWVVGEVRHNGARSRAVMSALQPDGTTTLLTEGGVGDPRGEWTFVIDRLDGPNGETLAGPWTIPFNVP
jgi:hypothetical protein